MKLTDESIIVVKVDTQNLPKQRINELIASYKETFKENFPNNKILVLPQNVSIEILN
jgi:ribosomal protein S17E